MRATVALWSAIGSRSFRRYSTYRIATAAGIFTNVIFGVITSYAYIALWSHRPHLGGYDVTDALTYTWLGQAMIMPVAIWGGGFQEDFTERIRTGNIAIDLYRPTGMIPWWLVSDLGRATFHFLSRATPMIVAGALLFHLRYPGSPTRWLAFAVAAYLAVLVSFGVRFLVSLTAFWLMDSRGAEAFAAILGMFFSGMILPLVVFPAWARDVLLQLPWASLLQTPADIWLGKTGGWLGTVSALAEQLGWAAVLLVAAYGVLRVASRRIVVQGG